MIAITTLGKDDPSKVFSKFTTQTDESRNLWGYPSSESALDGDDILDPLPENGLKTYDVHQKERERKMRETRRSPLVVVDSVEPQSEWKCGTTLTHLMLIALPLPSSVCINTNNKYD